jgi:hypothetical protein
MEEQRQWHPTWHTAEHATSWGRAREAVRRDWQQTRRDLHVGGHELNQRASDTLKQAVGRQAIPPNGRTNPARVIGDLVGEWEWVEPPAEYGYSARLQFGLTYPEWCYELDRDLKREWESSAAGSTNQGLWDDVKSYVRYGYEFKS